MRINIRCVADLKEVACSNSGLKTCAAVLRSRRLSTLSLDSFTDGKDTLSKVSMMSHFLSLNKYLHTCMQLNVFVTVNAWIFDNLSLRT